MKRFIPKKILPGDILAVRSLGTFGKTIRGVLGSYTNHNAMFVCGINQWMIGEAIPPESTVSSLVEYEEMMQQGAECRVWRVPDATMEERSVAADWFRENCIGHKYPLSVARLWVFRFVNSLPWKIEGEWCTRLVWDAWCHIDSNILNRPDGRQKKNPTPRTLENRLVAGVLVDVTDKVIAESH